MKISADLRVDADALVAIAAGIARRAGRDVCARDAILREVRALADRPGDFFDLRAESHDGGLRVHAVPNQRLVRLLELIGGAP